MVKEAHSGKIGKPRIIFIRYAHSRKIGSFLMKSILGFPIF
jgi:hypothetical protein